jgi:hypothetical protein
MKLGLAQRFPKQRHFSAVAVVGDRRAWRWKRQEFSFTTIPSLAHLFGPVPPPLAQRHIHPIA